LLEIGGAPPVPPAEWDVVEEQCAERRTEQIPLNPG
jgi:hypothetical protein